MNSNRSPSLISTMDLCSSQYQNKRSLSRFKNEKNSKIVSGAISIASINS